MVSLSEIINSRLRQMGGYFVFMDTIIKKIIIETNNFKNLFPIKSTPFPKSKDFWWKWLTAHV